MWSLEKSPRRCRQRRRVEVGPAAGEGLRSPSAHRRETRVDHRAAQGRARRHRAGQLRGHTQGPACATSFRSHVSRRSRSQMTVASRHRGESWNRDGGGAGLRREVFPEEPPGVPPRRAPTPGRPHRTRSPPASARFPARRTHSCPRFGTPPAWPQGLPRGARLHQLELERGQEVNDRGGGPSLPPAPPATLPAETEART